MANLEISFIKRKHNEHACYDDCIKVKSIHISARKTDYGYFIKRRKNNPYGPVMLIMIEDDYPHWTFSTVSNDFAPKVSYDYITVYER